VDSCVIIHADSTEQEFSLRDCSRSVTIHNYADSKADKKKFIRKMMKIRAAIDELIEYVESYED
jgi:hypothetical protein